MSSGFHMANFIINALNPPDHKFWRAQWKKYSQHKNTQYFRILFDSDICSVEISFIIKPTGCTNFTNLLWHETLHVSDSSSVHHQGFIHCTLSSVICHIYVIQVCRQLSSRTRMELQFHPGPARKLSTNLYDIHLCWVYSEWTPDDGQRNCPKHVDFHAKINFWN